MIWDVCLLIITSGVVVAAGISLSRSADAIAEQTKIGRVWIGTVLLAGATSLPEVCTDMSAAWFGAVDLAVGDLFGSSIANMLILAVLDPVPPHEQVLKKAAFEHGSSACLAI